MNEQTTRHEGCAAVETYHNILVVEDSTFFQGVLNRALMEEGYHVTAAFDARAAWSMLEKEPANLILLDLHMPGLKGMEFLGMIRELPVWSGIPVIIITAHHDPGLFEEALRLKVASVVFKEKDFLQRLLPMIKQLLDRPANEEAPESFLF